MDTIPNVYDDPARAAAYATLEYPGTYWLAFRDLPALIAKHVTGTRALDFGCGAGRSTRFLEGLGFEAVGVDVSESMLARAREGARQAGTPQVRFEKGDMRALPIADESVDVAISNGVINLAPDKTKVFSELYRIVKPGGRLQFADIVVGTELSDAVRNNIDLWTG